MKGVLKRAGSMRPSMSAIGQLSRSNQLPGASNNAPFRNSLVVLSDAVRMTTKGNNATTNARESSEP